eukprot:gene7585-7790_t
MFFFARISLVLQLLLAPALTAANDVSAQSNTVERFGWLTPNSRNYYFNCRKPPCMSPPPSYRPPKLQYPRPTDPVKPQVLSCPPGYGYVQSLTGTPYANYPDYKGGAMCIPCESGFYSPALGEGWVPIKILSLLAGSVLISPEDPPGLVPYLVLNAVDATQGLAVLAAGLVLPAGYGLSSSACALCPLGTFWPGPAKTAVDVGEGLEAAAAAQNNKKKRATLSPCLPCEDPNGLGSFNTLQQGSVAVNQCVCKPGYGGKLCNVCPLGTYSPGGTTADCIACGGVGTTTFEGATSPTQCGCQPGSGGVNCDRCPADSYSPGGTQVECIPCPVNTMARPASSSSDLCVPKPGFGLVNGIAVPGTFGTVVNGSGTACQTCPPGTTTEPGYPAAFASDCNRCIPGFGFGANGACQQCPAGTYSPGGRTSCVLCPLGMSSAPGSDATSDCFCNVDGFGWDGTRCVVCPKGSYSAPDRGVNQCVPCAAGQTTLLRPGQVGANSSSQCVCAAGYGTPPGAAQQCAPCLSPFYQGVNGTTTATLANPFPPCVQCTGVPATQITGDVNGLCTFSTTRPSAYCASATAIPPLCATN